MIIVTAAEAAALNLAVTLTGQDGSVWDLVDGPVRLASGVRVMGRGDVEHRHNTPAGLDGSFYVDSRVLGDDPPQLPVRIRARTPGEWRDLDVAFRRAVDGYLGWFTLTVAASDQPGRSARFRTASGLDPALASSPFLEHPLGNAATYPLELYWDFPFWTVDPVSYTYTGSDLLPYNTVTPRSVENPGDVPPWPTWTLHGGFAGATVGTDVITGATGVVTGGQSFVTFGDVGDTETRTVYMDPRHDGVAVVDGTGAEKWSDVTDREFGPIPTGTANVYIGLTSPRLVTSTPSISLTFSPAYRQAW